MTSIAPHSVSAVTVVYSQSSVFALNSDSSSSDDFSLLWGFQDASSASTRSKADIGILSSSGGCGNVRFGYLQLAAPMSGTISSAITSTTSSTSNLGASVSAHSPLVLDLFRRRPPLVVQTAVVPDRSLHTSDSTGIIGSSTIDLSMSASICTQRVQLFKYADLAVRADLLRNEVFDRFFKRFEM